MAISLTLNASRTTGPAPLNVILNSIGSTTTGLATAQTAYLGMAMHWNCGDIYDSRSNKLVGPQTQHTFTVAGTYTVTLFGVDETGATANTTQTITVTDPDTVFATTDTIVVADITGNGGTYPSVVTGQTEVDSAVFDTTISTYYGEGKRVLFRRGDTFTHTGLYEITTTTDSQVGACGTGTGEDATYGTYANDPIISGDATSAAAFKVDSEKCTIYNLSFDTLDTGGSRAIVNSDNSQNKHLAILHCYFRNYEYGINLAGAGAGVDQSRHQYIGIYGCQFGERVGSDELQEYGAFLQIEDSFVSLCRFDQLQGGSPESQLRFNKTNKSGFSDCLFFNPSANKVAFTGRSEADSTPLSIQYTGSGTVVSLDISSGTLTTTVDGARDLSIDLTDSTYDTLGKLATEIDLLSDYSCSVPQAGSYSSNDWLSADLADQSFADIKTAAVLLASDAHDAQGEYLYIARNTCYDGTNGVDWLFQFGPGSTGRPFTELFRTVLIEDNLFSCTGAVQSTPVICNTYNVAFRNNCQYTTQASTTIATVDQRGTLGPIPDNVTMFGTSIYMTSTSSTTTIDTTGDVADDGILVANTLVYKTSGTHYHTHPSYPAKFDGEAGSVTTATIPFTDAANLDFTLIGSPPAGIVDSGATEVSADSGTRLVNNPLDYQQKLRDATPDVGASESGASTWDPDGGGGGGEARNSIAVLKAPIRSRVKRLPTRRG